MQEFLPQSGWRLYGPERILDLLGDQINEKGNVGFYGSYSGGCRMVYFYVTCLGKHLSYSNVIKGIIMEGKRVSESRTYMTDLVLPPDTNLHGTIFGGRVMAYVDKIASITAMRHCRKAVVTASSDSLDFLAPIKVGEAIQLEAFVTWTHHTSMEIFCRIQSENLMTGEKTLTATSYLTFVALDEDGKPAIVPSIIPEMDEEWWHYNTAAERRETRLKRRKDRAAAEISYAH